MIYFFHIDDKVKFFFPYRKIIFFFMACTVHLPKSGASDLHCSTLTLIHLHHLFGKNESIKQDREIFYVKSCS